MVVRTVACESLAELSWLVWDVEDSLEFYPAQASQSFFSLPRSLRPRNRLERPGLGPQSGQTTAVTVVVLVSYLALTRREGESSQQRQGARRAEETGR
ncbi:hypothetical protein Taro_005327 [Colocasia esculenta]|uniref:Uncharacterized protein n=1 Tax=Colocasia esculenta TaxID=4460 RepID=A0A843TU98_COLES|nr:hypothetical protein [Colocasia esculenta]